MESIAEIQLFRKELNDKNYLLDAFWINKKLCIISVDGGI